MATGPLGATGGGVPGGCGPPSFRPEVPGGTPVLREEGVSKSKERPEPGRGQQACPQEVHMLMCMMAYANRLLIGACDNSKDKTVDF